jgi:methylenetetrahydrofolate dehydrogenase (NADP+)/methenyltetrahydrofolate cyclohydrolase
MPIYKVDSLKNQFKSFIKAKIANDLNIVPKFGIILVGDDFASQKYIEMKLKMAQELGVETEFFHFTENVEKTELKEIVSKYQQIHGGLIFQLPIKTELKSIIEEIPYKNDVDLLGLGRFILLQNKILPPTIGAIDLILKDIFGKDNLEKVDFNDFIVQKVDFKGLNVAIVGQGVLVGLPLLEYFSKSGASIISLNQDTKDIKTLTQTADILISATGVGGLIDETWLKSPFVKNGIQFPIVIDAGTSEGQIIADKSIATKVLTGDVNTLRVEKVCTLVAVPGGVGPITVRYIFWNLYLLEKL